MKLIEYIEKNFDGNRAAFAEAQGVTRQHVQKWLAGGWLVMGDTLVSPRRKLVKNNKK